MMWQTMPISPNELESSPPEQVILPSPQSAWDLLQKDSLNDSNAQNQSLSHNTGITTGSACLDEILGGSGIELNGITEICGLPGIGKTQLAYTFLIPIKLL
jgi:predicted ATP-dependent serine protease